MKNGNPGQKIFLVTFNLDIESTPGALTHTIMGAYTDKARAKEECKRLENELEYEDHYGTYRYHDYDLSSPPFYYV